MVITEYNITAMTKSRTQDQRY